MTTVTITLPDDLVRDLGEYASNMTLSRNRIIEKALRLYFEHLNRAQYIQSFKQANEDSELTAMAEEGMRTYLSEIELIEN